MGREVVGHVECPECGFESAEIKFQKGGLAYRWCPECSAQYFPRTEAASARLIQKIGKPVTVAPVTVAPVTVAPVTDTGASYPAAPVTAPAPAAPKPDAPIETPGTAPPRKGTGNALLDLAMGIKP